MPYGRKNKTPKPGMLGSGMAGRAGSALAMKRQIERMEMDWDMLTEEEKSKLALMRDQLSRLQSGKK